MTETKSTKRAFLASLVALMLCIAMLLGTTYAWFTDSVTSGQNTIQSGNLDMKVSYRAYGEENADKWETVKADSPIFNDAALYEPGYTEAIWLKVENKGSLAFKYQMALNVFNEVAGKTQTGDDIYLSDYLTVRAMTTTDIAGWESFYNTREKLDSFNFNGTANSKETTLEEKTVMIAENGVALPEGNANDTMYVLVILQMPTTVGNEANHNGVNVPSIEFGLEANATQLPYEEDAFGSDYDANATYLNLPKANVSKVPNLTVPVYQSNEPLTLDCGYQFQPTDTAEEVEMSPYKYYHADFVVKSNKDVPAGAITLAGYYEAFCSFINNNWVALTSDAVIEAGTEIRLVELMGVTVNYEEICQYGNDKVGFMCGAAKTGDLEEGTVLDVELRLYETTADPSTNTGNKNIETGKYHVIGSFSHAF